MPRKRTREEDLMWRAIIVIILAVITGGWGLLIGVFLFWPYIKALLRDLTRPKGPGKVPTPDVPSLPKVISSGLYVRIPDLVTGREVKLTVGFRNLWNRTMTVEIKLDELGRIGNVSPASFFLTLKPGEYAERVVRFLPKRSGRFSVSLIGRVGVFIGRKEITLNVRDGGAIGSSVAVETPSKRSTEAEWGNVNRDLKSLLSRYSDVSLIGEGGFGKVYRARRRDGTWVALKVPHVLSEESGRVFIREVSVWRELRHANIVRLYEANLYPYPYIEMELCDRSLEDLRKPIHWEEVARLSFEIAEGLRYAHSRGIIHRDLKPSNILLKGSKPKISDWGLAKVLTESRSTTGMVFTPYYAAPEQISPSRFGRVDERTDIWQLGVLMYELVTGRLPFDGSDFVEVAGRVTMEEPVPPSKLNPEVKPIEPMIMKCLTKGKEGRYRSLEELQRELAELLGGRYREELRRSTDFSRSAYYAGQLLLLHMRLNDAREAYKCALDLRRYARGETRRELEELIKQLEIRINEGLPIPQELVEKAEVVVHEVSSS